MGMLAEKSPTSNGTFLLPCAALVFSSGEPQNHVPVWGQVMLSAQPEQQSRREPRLPGHPAQGRGKQALLWSWKSSERHVLQPEKFGNPVLVGMCWDKGATVYKPIAGDAKVWVSSVYREQEVWSRS